MLLAFFRELGPRRRREIVGVVSDPSPAYRNALDRAVPHAIHLLDRFHIIKRVNGAVDEIRREAFGAAPKDDISVGRSK